MKLPKLEYPKRKLAVSPEQLMAIETLYEPYLPVPPIGIHKIISKQLRLDEWRVHVGIGLIRKNRSMDRWNEDREDLPAGMREQIEAQKEIKAAEKAAAKKKPVDAAATPAASEPEAVPEENAAPKAKKKVPAVEENGIEAGDDAVEKKPVKKKAASKAKKATEPDQEPEPVTAQE